MRRSDAYCYELSSANFSAPFRNEVLGDRWTEYLPPQDFAAVLDWLHEAPDTEIMVYRSYFMACAPRIAFHTKQTFGDLVVMIGEGRPMQESDLWCFWERDAEYAAIDAASSGGNLMA
jgi:hypothetical protein